VTKSSSPVREPARFELRVRYAETDRMGVVYHSHYLVWCEAFMSYPILMAGQCGGKMQHGLVLC
jgi:hypothetical protein